MDIDEEDLDKSLVGIIKAWFNYDGETGEITWKDWVSPAWYSREWYYTKFLRERAGKPVEFYKIPSGHLRISAGGRSSIYAHHIAWVHMYGDIPRNHIDHIDGNPENNAAGNLRDVPNKINCRNRGMRSDNTSGVTGVIWDKKIGKWLARCKVNGKYSHLGHYTNIEDAKQARQEFIDTHKQLGFTERHGKR